MTLDNLIGKGLQREPTDAEEIARFLAKISQKLEDSSSTSISASSRFDVAYEAVLQIGLAALRANGLRVDSRGGHHVLALQTLGKSIGVSVDVIRLLDEFRRQRADGLYNGSFDPSEAEVLALIQVGRDLERHFRHWLGIRHPELLG